MHLSDEELVLHYYGELDEQKHLGECPECRERWRALQASMNLMSGYAVPEPDARFEERVWSKVRGQIGARRRRFAWWVWMAPVLAAACLAVAFYAGRATKDPDGVTAVVYLPPAKVLRAATAEHLERSEMVLVESANGEASAMRTRAAELLSQNRLLRREAVQAGKLATAELLDELERVLVEIARGPERMNQEQANALKARIADEGLLFRVRMGENKETDE
jgi:hypothetical protein